MSLSENLAKMDRFVRPLASLLPPKYYTELYSRSRKEFLARLSEEEPANIDIDRWIKPVKLWDIKFNNNLFNAAGMFKNGKGYNLCALQGAGAWLAGTSTSKPRAGNKKLDILQPFLAMPRTKSAVNWLGLPNDGHAVLAKKISKIEKIQGCPIGISISSDPSETGIEALKSLVEGLNNFVNANVDFIELNESCPNVSSHKKSDGKTLDTEMTDRLDNIKNKFLSKRKRNLPVIVKYSVDTDASLLDELIPLLIDCGFDGINIGNTSTAYSEYLPLISEKEKASFRFFTENFGGGVSGHLIRNKSLELCRKANDILKNTELKKEFHIVRTGGIENQKDLVDSQNAGVSLNQWYTGYFENFSLYGHNLYKKLYSGK